MVVPSADVTASAWNGSRVTFRCLRHTLIAIHSLASHAKIKPAVASPGPSHSDAVRSADLMERQIDLAAACRRAPLRTGVPAERDGHGSNSRWPFFVCGSAHGTGAEAPASGCSGGGSLYETSFPRHWFESPSPGEPEMALPDR